MTLDLDRLERLLSEATPGPWTLDERNPTRRYGVCRLVQDESIVAPVPIGSGSRWTEGNRENLLLIAALRNSAEALIERARLADKYEEALEAIEGRLERYEHALDTSRDENDRLSGRLLAAIDERDAARSEARRQNAELKRAANSLVAASASLLEIGPPYITSARCAQDAADRARSQHLLSAARHALTPDTEPTEPPDFDSVEERESAEAAFAQEPTGEEGQE